MSLHSIWMPSFKFSSVQSLSHARLFVTPWTAACQTSLSITNSLLLLLLLLPLRHFSSVRLCATPQPAAYQAPPSMGFSRQEYWSGVPLHQLPEFTQTHVHWVGDAIQPSHPLSSPSPPAFNLSQHRVLSNESALHISWPKYWSFSFSISLSNEYSGLIYFRTDWFDLLAGQRTLKSLLQHPVHKHQFFDTQPFFTVQLSHPSMTSGKTIALTRQNFVSKVMSLLSNKLSGTLPILNTELCCPGEVWEIGSQVPCPNCRSRKWSLECRQWRHPFPIPSL